ncbi:cell wall protein IFF6-like isoform X1 [Odontomachus brunneus]|uniref:cell wall protein IFF6-like isoform X1 n=1 Tax=Odontomachus brunneus TaxID=486640 RepID=UPI0013F29DAD|nr:cell wall protein IFF6-like isoform X1 [Odontomachus brunneus]XP_032666880.1 cell wall protein IFF6-like isoform X1 [Odontomachus brunneus]
MSKTKKDVRKSEEHSSFSSCTSSSSDEEVDARDLKPIKEYLSNRKELARQLFKSVKSDKIRMMLPQVLKQVDLNELEQWCVSELSGMSKTRIISILNDKPMLESSDTSESEDSGPSLEIISDTEEWLTDDDTCKKEEDGKKKLKRNKIKVKSKAQVGKTSDIDKSNAKGKLVSKNDNDDKTKDIKIKKEDGKDKEKEGDSLLDLLELEMRARAIRALIRKEEDIIPSANSSQTNNSQTTDNDTKALQDDAMAKEDCRKQLERIINAKQGNIGEDEDVVLVVQPTPVVELLSSESDEGGHKDTRVNQKLKSKRVAETEESAGNLNEDPKNSQHVQNSKDKETQETIASHNNTSTVARADLNTRSETKTKISERNVDIKNNILSISISADNVADKRKKSKRKLRAKSQLASSTCNIIQNSSQSKRMKNVPATEQPIDIRDENINEQLRTSPISNESKVTIEEDNSAKEKTAEESKVEKERSADSDEIIDLDDYCDVMDMDNCDDDKSQNDIVSPQRDKQSVLQAAPNVQTSESSETWASRYYQTDDVQSVIKESKIQSEIRKRLRERQRLSKLNKSPNTNSSSQTSANQVTVISEKAPTGSVEEYLALKRATNANIGTSNSDSDNTATQNSDNTATQNSDNTATQNSDNTATQNSDNTATQNSDNTATQNSDNTATQNSDNTATQNSDNTATQNSDNTATQNSDNTATQNSDNTATQNSDNTATQNSDNTATQNSDNTATQNSDNTATQNSDNTATQNSDNTATQNSDNTATQNSDNTATQNSDNTATQNSDNTATQNSDNTATQNSDNTATQNSDNTATQNSDNTATQNSDNTATQNSDNTATQNSDNTATQNSDNTATQNSDNTATQNSDNTATQNSDNTAIQNPAAVNSDNDVSAKENSVQDESIPSDLECPDSTDVAVVQTIVQTVETNCSSSSLPIETVAVETTEEVLDTTNNNEPV